MVSQLFQSWHAGRMTWKLYALLRCRVVWGAGGPGAQQNTLPRSPALLPNSSSNSNRQSNANVSCNESISEEDKGKQAIGSVMSQRSNLEIHLMCRPTMDKIKRTDGHGKNVRCFFNSGRLNGGCCSLQDKF